MLFIIQLIYIKEGQEEVFRQFEDNAIPIISQYNGRFLLRVRPDETSIIESNIEKHNEIHLLQFATESDFEAFMKDEARKQFLHRKEQLINSVMLF